MIVLGVREVKLASLQLPGDLRARMETANVADLADDLSRWSRYIHDPLVRESDMRIIAGRDRLSAAKRLGLESIEVKLCECTDQEAEELELAENLHRRHDDDQVAMRKAWLDVRERAIAAERAGKQQAPARGKPSTPRGQARKELAAKLGVSKQAIEKLDAEPTPEPDEADWGVEPEPPPPPPVDLMGTEPDEAWLEQVREVQGLMDEADKQARALQATLTKLHGLPLAPDEARWQRLYKAAHAIGRDARGFRPKSVCPYCKLVPLLRGVCTACRTMGYVVEEDIQGIPAELLDVEKRLVAQNGRFVRIDEVKAELVAPPGAKKRTLRIEYEGVDEPKGGE